VTRKHDDRGFADVQTLIIATAATLILAGAAAFYALAVVPWQQDRAAMSILSSVAAAENSVSSANGRYLDLDGLKRRQALTKEVDSTDLVIHPLTRPYDPQLGTNVHPRPSGTNFVAFYASESGRILYVTESTKPSVLPQAP